MLLDNELDSAALNLQMTSQYRSLFRQYLVTFWNSLPFMHLSFILNGCVCHVQDLFHSICVACVTKALLCGCVAELRCSRAQMSSCRRCTKITRGQ